MRHLRPNVNYPIPSLSVIKTKFVNRSKVWLIVKICLALTAVWFIYLKVTHHESSGDYINQLLAALSGSEALLLFSVVFVLMLLNWLIEAVKWRYMIKKIEEVSVGRAMEAVFSGLTISFFTPNRIGEYAGRVFHLHKGKRMQATLVTVIENSSQLLVTLLSGSIACIIYMNDYMDISPMMNVLFRIMLILFCLFCLVLYFNLDLFEKFSQRFKMSEYWKQIFHVFSLYSGADLFKVLLLSLFRYLVFSIQFYLLLYAYGSYLPILPSLLMIAMTFFVMSVIPTFTLTELGVRGAIAVYFFGKLTIDVVPVLNATFSLWLINLVVPALLGAVFIFHFRLEKNER